MKKARQAGRQGKGYRTILYVLPLSLSSSRKGFFMTIPDNGGHCVWLLVVRLAAVPEVAPAARFIGPEAPAAVQRQPGKGTRKPQCSNLFQTGAKSGYPFGQSWVPFIWINPGLIFLFLSICSRLCWWTWRYGASSSGSCVYLLVWWASSVLGLRTR